jgi:hypothetical protein
MLSPRITKTVEHDVHSTFHVAAPLLVEPALLTTRTFAIVCPDMSLHRLGIRISIQQLSERTRSPDLLSLNLLGRKLDPAALALTDLARHSPALIKASRANFRVCADV